ncbi:hypothetical protein C8J56DRAFT_1124062 [Mycena floridula]|nr:hypothetical protein C8J56DRAFT_1124062 [Mycena floridula]
MNPKLFYTSGIRWKRLILVNGALVAALGTWSYIWKEAMEKRRRLSLDIYANVLQKSTMSLSDAQIYSNSLVPKKHGYPLWIPEPPSNLPEAYRSNGIRVGDLVCLTEDGGYDYLFNIFSPETDPVNIGRVPNGFAPLFLDDHDIITYDNLHKPGANISTMTVKKLELSGQATTSVPGIPIEFGGGFEFKSSSSHGGILVLPDGASRITYRNLSRLKEFILENIQLWFGYANGARGRETSHLCLVTGCDKSRSWGTAAFSTSNSEQEVSLKFVAANLEGGFSYTWNTVNSAAVRVSSIPCPFQNQTVFIRGFNLTQRMSRFGKRIRVDISDVSSLTWKPPSRLTLRAPGQTTFFPASGSTGIQPQSSGSMQDSDSSDPDSVNHNATIQKFHPGESINESILLLDESAEYAVTHDDDWILLDTKEASDLYTPDVLIAKILDQRHHVTEKGIGFFEESSGPSGVGAFSTPQNDIKEKLEERALYQDQLDDQPVDAAELAADVTFKRGRGRPKGSRNKKSSNAGIGSSSTPTILQRRGGPSKKKKEDDSGADEAPQRKRGRPPKHPKPEMSDDDEPLVKKRRGRPPKKPHD